MTNSRNQGNVLNFLRHTPAPIGTFTSPNGRSVEHQLHLPFNELNTLILIRESEIDRSQAFIGLISKFEPQYILDVRIAPRMDFVANSRALTFKAFRESGIEYIDLLGRIDIHSLEEFAARREDLYDSISSVISEEKATSRPILCFFDDERLLELCRNILPSAVKLLVASGEEPNVSMYRSGLLAV